MSRDDLPQPGAAASPEDEERLERRLPVSSKGSDRLITGEKKAMTGRDANSTAAVREVKP